MTPEFSTPTKNPVMEKARPCDGRAFSTDLDSKLQNQECADNSIVPKNRPTPDSTVGQEAPPIQLELDFGGAE